MAKQKRKSILKRYTLHFYECIKSDWDSNRYLPVGGLPDMTITAYSVRQARAFGRKLLRDTHHYGYDSDYGSVAHDFDVDVKLVEVVSEEEILKKKQEAESRKERKRKKKNYEQLSLFDNYNEDEK